MSTPNKIQKKKNPVFDKRWNHSMSFVNDKLYLFAGFDSQCNYNSICTFDFQKQKFKRVKATGQIPPHRAAHSAIVRGNEIIVFGGMVCNGGPYFYFNDCFVFNTDTLEWRELKTTGSIPSKRSQHCSILYKNRYMFVFFGQNESTTFNDIHVLDLETNNWIKLNAPGAPAVRSFKSIDFRVNPCRSSAFLFEDQTTIVLQGEFGVRLFDIQKMEWKATKNSLSFPRKTCCVAVKHQTKIFLYGGYDVELSDSKILTSQMFQLQIQQ